MCGSHCIWFKFRAVALSITDKELIAQSAMYLFIAQLRQYIKHGIPDDMRGQVWKKLIGNQAIKVMSSFSYQVILSLVNAGQLV